MNKSIVIERFRPKSQQDSDDNSLYLQTEESPHVHIGSRTHAKADLQNHHRARKHKARGPDAVDGLF